MPVQQPPPSSAQSALAVEASSYSHHGMGEVAYSPIDFCGWVPSQRKSRTGCRWLRHLCNTQTEQPTKLSISLKGFKKVQTSLVEGMNANVGRQLVLRKFKVNTHVAVAPAAEASRRDGSAALRAIFMRVGKPLASSRLRTILNVAALRVNRTPRPLGGLRSTLRGTCPRPNMIQRPTM
jgi:hypothetical protein